MANKDSIQLFSALHRLGRQMHRCSHRMEHSHGHYRELSRLLLLIAGKDGVIQRDLADEMDVRPSSMTEMLVKMEQLGLIIRKQDEKDQRVMHIYLTETGESAAEESQSDTEKLTTNLFLGLSDDEIKQMLYLTEKLCEHLDSIDSADPVSEAHHGHHRGFDCNYCHKGHPGFDHHGG